MPGMSMPRSSFTLHNALTQWMWSPFPLVMVAVLAAAAYWYLRADFILAARGRRWPASRTASFMTGLVAVELALQSPVATLTGTYFEAHIIQHLLLMAAAPALLALGAPSTLMLQTVSRKTKRRWLKVLRSRPFALITHPVSAWVLYFGVMFWFFLTPLINTAMLHMPLMDVLNLVFLFGGCLYWWPMVGTDPIIHWKMGYGARMVNMLLGGAVETFLGIAILMDHNPIASMYSLSSTHAGGGLLWASTELATVGGFIPIILQWIHSDERAAARADTQTDVRAMPAASGAKQATAGPGSAGPGSAGPGSSVTTRPKVHPSPRPATGPAFQVAGGDAQMTTWESAWLARTGSVPSMRGAPAARDDDQ